MVIYHISYVYKSLDAMYYYTEGPGVNRYSLTDLWDDSRMSFPEPLYLLYHQNVTSTSTGQAKIVTHLLSYEGSGSLKGLNQNCFDEHQMVTLKKKKKRSCLLIFFFNFLFFINAS